MKIYVFLIEAAILQSHNRTKSLTITHENSYTLSEIHSFEIINWYLDLFIVWRVSFLVFFLVFR